MIRYILPILLGGILVVVGLGRADDEGDQAKKEEQDKPRLKRKKRDNVAPPVKEPANEDKDKDKKDKAKEEEKLIPEDGPMGEPEEDDVEILERVNRNMRAVEEKLGNREVGDPTAQQQRDILKDLDALIRRSQQQEQGGGADDQQQQQGGMADQKQGAQKQGKRGSRRAQRQPRPGRGQGQKQGSQLAKAGQGKGQGKGKGQENPEPGGNGNNPGKGGNGGPKSDKELEGKNYKDVWGHLPRSLRAEMDAYSNPRPFMPRYDDLIKKYYRTIAEQGRKTGD